MTKLKNQTSWKGNRPSIKKGWRFVDFVECHGEQWEIYFRARPAGQSWMNIKAISCNRISAKANYHISWSAAEHRFANGTEFAKLVAQRPALRARIEDLVSESVS